MQSTGDHVSLDAMVCVDSVSLDALVHWIDWVYWVDRPTEWVQWNVDSVSLDALIQH